MPSIFTTSIHTQFATAFCFKLGSPCNSSMNRIFVDSNDLKIKLYKMRSCCDDQIYYKQTYETFHKSCCVTSRYDSSSAYLRVKVYQLEQAHKLLSVGKIFCLDWSSSQFSTLPLCAIRLPTRLVFLHCCLRNMESLSSRPGFFSWWTPHQWCNHELLRGLQDHSVLH